MVVPGPRGARTQVAIPAQGLIEFKDQLSDMLERYNTIPDSNEQADHLPDSKSLRAENKTFFFDYGTNQRGAFLKISEVGNFFLFILLFSKKYTLGRRSKHYVIVTCCL